MSTDGATMQVLDTEVAALLEDVFQRYHYDFRRYSMASLKRRVALALPKLGCHTVLELRHKLTHEPHTLNRLLQFLTVQVSDVFRDPPFFVGFRAHVASELETYPSLKIWVAGCSSGEEVYSLAITLAECRLLDRTLIYATDINPEALQKAEAGVYALDRIDRFAENYALAGGTRQLSDYYTSAYGNAVFSRTLRSNVVFSDHSLATDHVFAEVQVVACRNVLIYFDRTLQTRALGLFTDALCRRGFLGLGARETLQFSACAASYKRDLEKQKWYQKW